MKFKVINLGRFVSSNRVENYLEKMYEEGWKFVGAYEAYGCVLIFREISQKKE